MPQSQAAPDLDKLREFELRMYYEGAAAFAAGPSPWEDWDYAGTLGTWRRVQDTQHHTPHRRKSDRTVGQRLLGAVTRLLVLILLIGIGGVLFSSATQPPVVISGIRPAPIVATLPRIRPDMQGADTLAEKLDTLPAPSAGFPGGPVPETVPIITPPVPVSAPAPAVTADRQVGTAIAPVETASAPSPADNPTESSTALSHSPPPEPPLSALPQRSPAQVAQAQPIDPNPVAATPSLHPESPAAPAAPAPIATHQASADQPASSAPPPLARLGTAETADTGHANPAQTPPPLVASTPKDGDWVVNLAAYRSEAEARRALAEFRDKGVEAEIFHVTVHDHPMIRIRATGYHTAREAHDWAGLLEERLGLEGVWISKR